MKPVNRLLVYRYRVDQNMDAEITVHIGHKVRTRVTRTVILRGFRMHLERAIYDSRKNNT